MAAVDKAALLATRGIGTETVAVPGIGDVIVRGLSRAEVLSLQKSTNGDLAEAEAQMLSLAMVEPAMTIEDVKAWQEIASSAELDPVSEAVARKSGLADDAVKEQIKRFR